MSNVSKIFNLEDLRNVAPNFLNSTIYHAACKNFCS